jgi:DNA-binding LytR/AlgR family response regulator
MEVKCIAIDDEPLALEIICDYIAKVPFLKLVRTFDNAIDSIDFIKSKNNDLIFLDIQMEALTGIQLLKVLKDKPEVIFTTAYDSYALEGFELDAADYLLKPFSFERFIKAVDKVYNIIKLKNNQGLQDDHITIGNPVERYIFVKTGNKLQKVFFNDILFIEGQGDYLRINTNRERIMTLQKFSSLEELLPQSNFIRVHKSFMVAIDKIESITRNRIKIGNELIPIGESFKKKFYDRLEGKKLG